MYTLYIYFEILYMLLDLSSDVIKIFTDKASYLLDRQQIEEQLPATFLDLVRHASEVYVLNGPGGFTYLRVGCLVVNMLLHYVHRDLPIYDVSKLQLYAYAVHRWFLAPTGLIYIGQRKQVWLYDFLHNKYELVGLDYIPTGEYFVEGFSVDIPDHKHRECHVRYGLSGMLVSWGGENLIVDATMLWLHSAHVVQARYMIQPTIG